MRGSEWEALKKKSTVVVCSRVKLLVALSLYPFSDYPHLVANK